MNWDGPMLTDSGGFQIFSLGYGSVSEEIKRKKAEKLLKEKEEKEEAKRLAKKEADRLLQEKKEKEEA